MSTLKQIAVHHTAVFRTTSPQLWGVNRYHKNKWGMRSQLGWYVGYNEFVDVDGTRTKTRVWGEETVANRGHNCDIPERCDTYSVCFALDGDVQMLNKEQVEAWREIKQEYPHVKTTLHKNIQENRTCPGRNITLEYLNDILDDDEDQLKPEQIRYYMRELDRLLKILKDLRAKLGL